VGEVIGYDVGHHYYFVGTQQMAAIVLEEQIMASFSPNSAAAKVQDMFVRSEQFTHFPGKGGKCPY
jgi:hypothetical protein